MCSSDSALIVLTDSQGIETIYSQETVKPLVLSRRAEKAKTLLFINVDTKYVEAVVLLDQSNPFTPWPDCPASANIKQPNVAEVLDFVEPFEAVTSDLYAWNQCSKALHHEAFLIENNDAEDLLYGPVNPLALTAELTKAFEANKGNINISNGLRYLKGKGGDTLARIQEFVAEPVNTWAAIDTLPTNWRKVLDDDKHDQILQLLNSMADVA